MKAFLISLIHLSFFFIQITANFERVSQVLNEKGIKQSFLQSNYSYNSSINAKKFLLNLRDNALNATGKVIVKQNDLFLTANTVDYNMSSNHIKLNNEVSIKKNKLWISTNKADARLPLKIQFFNGINFEYNEFKGQADEATYNLDKSTINLKGKALIKENSRVVKGNDIIFDIKKETVVSQGKAKIKFKTEN